MDEANRAKQKQLQDQYGHAELIQKWVRISALKDWAQRTVQIKQEIAPELGQWPADKPDDCLVSRGYAFNVPRLGTNVTCRFLRIDPGLATMTRWLFAQGASDVRYQIYGSPVRSDEGEGEGN